MSPAPRANPPYHPAELAMPETLRDTLTAMTRRSSAELPRLFAARYAPASAHRVRKSARTPRRAYGKHILGALAVTLCLLAATMPRARAAEHITLSNGFELNCDHRAIPATDQSAASVKVRLYLDAAEANYLEVAPEEIVTAELLSTLPVTTPLHAPPAATSHGDLSPAELRELLTTAGTTHNLDVDLLASVVHAESASHTHAVSRAGARGLMQLMPATAAELGIHDSFAPQANVNGGTAYLDGLLKRYHDNLALALAAYNAGPGAVDRWHGIPPYGETRAYVARIIHEFNRRYSARQAAAALAMAR